MRNLYPLKTVVTAGVFCFLTAASTGTFTAQTASSSIGKNHAKAEISVDIFKNLGDSDELIAARKKLLMQLSKPGENVYRDLADRKERKLKGIKLPNERAGIEEMAEYRKNILKPIGATEISYEKGYLAKEYEKALNSPILARAEKADFAVNGADSYSLSNVFWKERGPNNIPGRNRSLIISPTNPDKWMVGSAGGGVWITSDAGKTWKNTTDDAVPDLATTVLAVSPEDPNVVYCGTGEPFGNLDAIAGYGILKSFDGGETWARLKSTENFGSIGRIAVNPTNSSHVIAASNTGIRVSKDGGAHWDLTFAGSGNYKNVQDIRATKDFSTIYASVNTYGIIKSTDGGATWNLVFDAVSKAKSIKRIELGISPADENTIYLSAEAGTSIALYMSSDSGATFSELTYDGGDSKEVLSTQGWYNNAVAAHPFDKNILYVGGVYAAKFTVDPAALKYKVLQIASGYDNTKLNTYVHPDQHAIVCQVNPADPAQFRMLMNNDGGIYYTAYKTNPGENKNDWIGPVTGMNTTQFYGADKKKGEDAYLGGAQDNGSSATMVSPASALSPYLSMFGGDGFEVIWNYKDPNKLLFGSQYNNFVISRSGVQNKTLYYARNSDNGSTYSPFYSKLANANNNADVIFTVSSRGVWRSPNFGTSWTLAPFTTATNGTWFGSASYATVKVSVANPDVVWAASAIGPGSSPYIVNVSKDNGQTFSKTTGSVPVSKAAYISGLSASMVNEARAFVTLSLPNEPKIVKTDDFGATWKDITGFNGTTSTSSTGFPNVPVHSVLEMPFNEKVIWAGTDIGVFETVDGGASWYIIKSLPAVSVWNMKIVDDQVVLATHGRGVWTATVPELKNYTMPEYVDAPSILSAAQAGIHDMRAKAVFRYTNPRISALKVYVDNNYTTTISGTLPNNDIPYFTGTLTEGIHTISVSGLYDNETKETIKTTQNVEIIKFNDGVEKLDLPQFTAADVYIGPNSKFVIDNVSGKFTYNVLNNVGHPYANNTNYQTYLRNPVIVGSNSLATMTHMALTEAQYDFAIVEASKDLINWSPIGVYDESKDPSWNNVASANVNESLFKTMPLNFSSKFAAGDEVAVRLRLTTDPAETRFGWVIKSIVPDSTLGTADAYANSSSIMIAPNPVADQATLFLPAGVKGIVEIGIYDASGKLMQTIREKASENISMNVANLSTGVYLVLVKGEGVQKAIKLLKK